MPGGDEGLGVVQSVDFSANVNYNVGEEVIPTTTTHTRSAAESCAHEKTCGREGMCGLKVRHFDINGSICVNEWLDSCEIEAGWEKTTGCSAKAQTCVSGLDDSVVAVGVGAAQPQCLHLTAEQVNCTCPCP